MKPEFVVAIGASAGGLNAVSELVSHFPQEKKVAVFIVLHLSKVGLGNFLIHRLQKYTNYQCKLGEDGEDIQADHIYMAPPDEHLLVSEGKIIIGQGPSENRWRPSIDVLFRSVAAGYGNRAIGIILTGFLNDGTSGMSAIKRSGGYCIVQDPNEAEYPDMPISVLESMEVDYCVALKEMAGSIDKIIINTTPQINTVPHEVVREAEISKKVVTSIDNIASMGTKSLYSCPDCGGGLWHVGDESVKRYRCHIGHAYSESDLIIQQAESLEATLWVALRMMEERRSLLTKVGEEDTKKGLLRIAENNKKRAKELEVHIEKLKEVLFMTRKD